MPSHLIHTVFESFASSLPAFFVLLALVWIGSIGLYLLILRVDLTRLLPKPNVPGLSRDEEKN